MGFKDKALKKGLDILSHPKVSAVMQDERMIKALMQGFEIQRDARKSFNEKVTSVAESFGLVTKKELRELKRQLRKVERELEQAKQQASPDEVKKQEH